MTSSSSQRSSKSNSQRNLISFWLFGICTNFVYVVMLSAAQDILHKEQIHSDANPANGTCLASTERRHCSPRSAGLVLLCNIVPSMLIKLLAPLVIHGLPYSVRHHLVIGAQTLSLVLVIFSDSILLALLGVVLCSFASGLGEITYLALASHYSRHTISTWSSGTGSAGIIGSGIYAVLTDARLLALSPSRAMLGMLVVPLLYTMTHHFLLVHPDGRRDKCPAKGSSARNDRVSDVETVGDSTVIIDEEGQKFSRLDVIKSLLIYIIPLFIVYFSQYLTNQGLAELTVFDCAHGFGTTPTGQYRWYQVMYQVGVFVSRTFGGLLKMSFTLLMAFPVIQASLALLFLLSALRPFMPHIAVACLLILVEGLVAGAMYVGSMQHVHKSVAPSRKEFSLLMVTVGNAVGIVLAACVSIPLHNLICETAYLNIF